MSVQKKFYSRGILLDKYSYTPMVYRKPESCHVLRDLANMNTQLHFQILNVDLKE